MNEQRISINTMLQLIDYYKLKLDQKFQKEVENSKVDTVQELVLEQKLGPLKENLKRMNETRISEEALTIENVTIVDKKQDPSIQLVIDTDAGANHYYKYNEYQENEEGYHVPKTTFMEVMEDEEKGMMLDEDLTIRKEISKALGSDIELFTDHSFLTVETSELDILFRFNLNQQFLVFQGKEKSIDEIPKQQRKEIGIALKDVPNDLMKYYPSFQEEQQKNTGVLTRIVKILTKSKK